MSDAPEDDASDTGEKSKAPWLWGGGIALAAVIGVAVASSGDGTDWSSNEAAAGAAEEQAEETAEAQAEKPEPKPDPDVRGVIKPKQESTVASQDDGADYIHALWQGTEFPQRRSARAV